RPAALAHAAAPPDDDDPHAASHLGSGAGHRCDRAWRIDHLAHARRRGARRRRHRIQRDRRSALAIRARTGCRRGGRLVAPPSPFRRIVTGKVSVVAHRGLSASAPENTMTAFKLAAEAGCDLIEFDVHLTKDDQLVVIHDDTLERTTNGTGYVRDHTLAEIKALDASNGFAAYTAERVP